ncbi:hypothetical protein CAL26_09850 [Bordetella genomosp. 9]|uniref:Uncharacterized protein n=1 Tax=Bordetella genomosp. 9 TaxID=1416803 RepID=A0A261RFJ4_9BORD|nr:hypothetical protein [Bordetella genomosp. 9]OZI23725.1 hypothetical protein CAL26_09850 [Bordetella genomosp. 9]
MKRTNQLRTGNVTGTGPKFRGPKAKQLAIPTRHLRPRKAKQPGITLPVGMSSMLVALFKRAGLQTPY